MSEKHPDLIWKYKIHYNLDSKIQNSKNFLLFQAQIKILKKLLRAIYKSLIIFKFTTIISYLKNVYKIFKQILFYNARNYLMNVIIVLLVFLFYLFKKSSG